MATIKWQQGKPCENGYYIGWNEDEDPSPIVMYCYVEPVEWWTVYVHQEVVKSASSTMQANFVVDLLDEYSKLLKLDDKKYKAINDFIDFIFENDGDYVDDYLKTHRYFQHEWDVPRPQYWIKLPDVFDDQLPEFEMEVTVEDATAQAVNHVASEVSRLIKSTMTQVGSPWTKHSKPYWKQDK